ncbi:hypothetical protein ACLOJK_009263 [Asimina triloba]
MDPSVRPISNPSSPSQASILTGSGDPFIFNSMASTAAMPASSDSSSSTSTTSIPSDPVRSQLTFNRSGSNSFVRT